MNNRASNDVKSNKGRPTKLTPELKAKAREYLHDFRSNEDIIPSIAGLACYLDIARSTLYEYRDKDDDFSDILERVEQKQEQMLINGGLMSDFNATITKLMMTKHGYSDKQDVDHTSKGKEVKAGLGYFYGETDEDEGNT